MVFGELLGGALERAGQRFHEASRHQRDIEDWQRQNDFNLKLDFLRSNWDNLTPSQQRSQLRGFAPLTGHKPDDLENLATQAYAIHSILPPAPSTPAAAPERQSAEQLPSPTTAPIYAPMPAHEISTVPLRGPTPTDVPGAQPLEITPAEFKQQEALRLQEQAQQHNIRQIRAAGLPRNVETGAIAGELTHYKIPALPYLLGEEKIGAQKEAQATALAAKQSQIQGAPRFVIRGGEQIPIYRRGQVETYYDPEAGQETRYNFQPGDKVYEKSPTSGIQLLQDDNGTYAINKPAAMAGTPGAAVKIPGLTGKPTPPPIQVDVRNPTTGEPERKVMTRAQANTLARKGGQQGVNFEKPNTAATQAKIDAARRSLEVGTSLMNFIKDPRVASQLGPIMGRYSNLTLALGDPSPLISNLRGKIASFAALQPGIHGMRNYNMMTHLEKLMENRMTPESMVSGIDGILDVSRAFVNSAGGVQGAGGDTVKVRLPDGRTGNIPRANLEKAKAMGAVEVQ